MRRESRRACGAFSSCARRPETALRGGAGEDRGALAAPRAPRPDRRPRVLGRCRSAPPLGRSGAAPPPAPPATRGALALARAEQFGDRPADLLAHEIANHRDEAL